MLQYRYHCYFKTQYLHYQQYGHQLHYQAIVLQLHHAFLMAYIWYRYTCLCYKDILSEEQLSCAREIVIWEYMAANHKLYHDTEVHFIMLLPCQFAY